MATNGKPKVEAVKKAKITRLYPRNYDRKVICQRFGGQERIEIGPEGILPESEEAFQYYQNTGGELVKNKPMPRTAALATSELQKERIKSDAMASELAALKAENAKLRGASN